MTSEEFQPQVSNCRFSAVGEVDKGNDRLLQILPTFSLCAGGDAIQLASSVFNFMLSYVSAWCSTCPDGSSCQS